MATEWGGWTWNGALTAFRTSTGPGPGRPTGKGRAVRPQKYPHNKRESIFVVAPLALSPSVSPGPVPVDLLNAVRAPFHVHLPHSVAMLVVRSHPNPKKAFISDQRSVGEPAPRARTPVPGYRAC